MKNLRKPLIKKGISLAARVFDHKTGRFYSHFSEFSGNLLNLNPRELKAHPLK